MMIDLVGQERKFGIYVNVLHLDRVSVIYVYICQNTANVHLTSMYSIVRISYIGRENYRKF